MDNAERSCLSFQGAQELSLAPHTLLQPRTVLGNGCRPELASEAGICSRVEKGVMGPEAQPPEEITMCLGHICQVAGPGNAGGLQVFGVKEVPSSLWGHWGLCREGQLLEVGMVESDSPSPWKAFPPAQL